MLNLILKYIDIMFNVKKKFVVFSETSGFKLHVNEREGKKMQQESFCFKLHISGKKNNKKILKNISFVIVFNRSKKYKRWRKASWATVSQ